MTEQDEMVTRYGAPHCTEMVPCVTSQWNHPSDPDRPFVGRDGRCAICHQEVEWEQYQPDNPNLYSRIATPHQRLERWFVVPESEIVELRGYRENW